MRRGVFQMCDETRLPHDGASLGCMMNLNRPIGEGGCVCKIYDETESQHDWACARHIIMSRNRHMKGRV